MGNGHLVVSLNKLLKVKEMYLPNLVSSSADISNKNVIYLCGCSYFMEYFRLISEKVTCSTSQSGLFTLTCFNFSFCQNNNYLLFKLNNFRYQRCECGGG